MRFFISYNLIDMHYGIFEKVFPIFVLHISLLLLNIFPFIPSQTAD
jgi:hypothetical protein